jgi:hypothetical protein
MMSAEPYVLELKNPEKANKSNYKNSGTLILTLITLMHVEPPAQPPKRAVEEKKDDGLPRVTFLDYIKGGCTINMMVAVDFTLSNNDPSAKNSLHYRFGDAPNQYQQAIRVIGDIVAPYDTDNMIAVYGFGGKCKKGTFNNRTSHCFALNFNEDNPEVKGVDGILNTYNESFEHLELSAPTNFAEFITKCSKLAKTPPVTQKDQHYNILLVITDGEITDMKETQQAIKSASTGPLSIIIVGVGQANFAMMKKLDGDDDTTSTDVSPISS